MIYGFYMGIDFDFDVFETLVLGAIPAFYVQLLIYWRL
jgi:hypothetical protein